jgi:hypothetical protein
MLKNIKVKKREKKKEERLENSIHFLFFIIVSIYTYMYFVLKQFFVTLETNITHVRLIMF